MHAPPMRRHRRKQQRRSAALKFFGWLALAFLLFWKELTYFLQAGWFRLRYYNLPLIQLEEANLISIPQLVEYVFHILVGLVLFAAVVAVANLFNAQFLLPVYSLRERLDVFRTFNNFMFGGHGPLVFVRDGEIISHLGESERSGPGVALVNSNSAVVVGSNVYGPGLVFTGGARIGKVMDLRKQVRTSRDVRAVTRDGIEVSTDITVQFSISAPPEVIYVCLEPPARRKENVRVLELDERGDLIVEIAKRDFFPDELNEIYRTLQRIEAGQTQGIPFIDLEQYASGLYVEERVQACYTNQPRRPDTGEKINWHELPADIAEEEFRNTIVRFPFDDLFLPTEQPPESEETIVTETESGELTASTRITAIDYLKMRRTYPLETIRREFSERVRNSGFLAYVFVQKLDGGPIKEGERLSDPGMEASLPVLLQYPRPLRRSQITVSSVSFGEIAPTNPEVRRQTVQNLIARWNSEAFRTEVGFDEQAAMIRSRAKAQVQQDTVYALRDVLRNSGKTKTALILRIFQALEAATAGSDNREMVSMVKMLGDLRDWFKITEKDLITTKPGSSGGPAGGRTPSGGPSSGGSPSGGSSGSSGDGSIVRGSGTDLPPVPPELEDLLEEDPE